MSDSLSPERQKTVKVKYSGRAKRRRSVLNDTQYGNQSEEESETSQIETMGEKPGAKASKEKTPEATSGPKKVDVHLPGPSPPKRARSDSEESQVLSNKPISEASKAPHSRRSSVSSLHRQRPESRSLRSVQSKPPSDVGPSAGNPQSSKRPDTPDEDDDASSIAESSNGGITRIRRTEPERIQYFKDQPDCGEMEPYRVFCKRCNKWVNLGRRTTYTVRPWETHRSRCDKKPAAVKDSDTQTAPDSKVEETDHPVETGPDADSTSSPVSKTPQDEEGDRLVRLKADPRAQEIRPHEVLCRSCHKWVKLSATEAYVLGNWEAHAQRCPGPAPNSRVATAERKLTLVSDPQVKTSTAQSVECAFCRSVVALEGAADYDLTKWNEHKTRCTVRPPVAQATPAAKASFSRRSRIFEPSQRTLETPSTPANTTARPPLSSSSASTEATAIASESPPARIGTKRGREEEQQEDDRPTNRPRAETYEPPHKEPPGPWGWFTQPFKAFVRGFREGLGAPTST
ncbi:hypothetical protein BV22DRAFT_390586 [Leucogyrophana mollusca]|uniref:Uncharacterized protein n=1 Tax=Leucogyrophana mollusca TaxID=85980 RepID=A0ACB8BKL9_9AGAM|nr:hypothetical protein BV22DRAFT_390586 [Leucogyrophana mollusca]